jgi:serine/threonine protein kinase
MDAGQRIGSYEVRALLGRGGMGAVFLGEHTVIGRKAAIKVLKPEFAANPILVRRFLNEARATNAIRHPGIVDVIDVGTLPGDVPYLVMEYLQGESLAQRLTQLGRFPVSQAVAVICQTASAVGAAHEQGIIHRDLKPENLFLIPDPLQAGRERVKVLDFGIAKLRAGLSPNTVDTRTGYLLGTPSYMSPEQCRGIHDEIDHRSDIYSLGILLYEMLCGVTPFVSSGFGDVLLMHMTEAPLPPSARNTLVPPAVEQVILRALAKKPEDRFQTMRDMRAALGEDLSAPSMTSVGFGQIAAPERTPAVTPISSGGRTPPPVASPGAVTEPSRRPAPPARDADSLIATTPKAMRTTPGREGLRKIMLGLASGGAVLLLALMLLARRHTAEPAAPAPPVAASARSVSPTITPLPPATGPVAPAVPPTQKSPARQPASARIRTPAAANGGTVTEPADASGGPQPETAERAAHGVPGDRPAGAVGHREHGKKSAAQSSPRKQAGDRLRVDQW